VLDMAPVDMAVITWEMVNMVDTEEMIGDIVNLVDTAKITGEMVNLVDTAKITGEMVNLVDTAEMIGDIVNLVDTMEMIGERMMLDMAPVYMAVITGKMVTLVDMAVIQYTDPVEEDTKMATEVDMAVGMVPINKDLDTETTGTTNRAEIMVDMAGTTNRLATEAAMAGIKRGPGILVDPPTTEEMVGDMSTRTPKLVDMEGDLVPATMKKIVVDTDIRDMSARTTNRGEMEGALDPATTAGNMETRATTGMPARPTTMGEMEEDLGMVGLIWTSSHWVWYMEKKATTMRTKLSLINCQSTAIENLVPKQNSRTRN